MAKTWQSATLNINPGAYQELSVLQGKANVFYVINPGDNEIYVSMSTIPRMDNYEKIIARNSADVFGRPTPVTRVYFYNPSSEIITATVWYTYSEDFDFSIMKSLSVNLDAAATEAIKNDGIIRGVQSGVTIPVNDSTLITVANAIKNILIDQGTQNAAIMEGINTIINSL